MATWKDKILNSDAGRGSPKAAQRMVKEVEGSNGDGSVVLPFLPQPFPTLPSTSQGDE